MVNSASISTGLQVASVTRNPSDAAMGTGYAAFIESVTGRQPQVYDVSGRAVLVMDRSQNAMMTRWIEKALTPGGKPSSVSVAWGESTTPLVIKYVSILVASGLIVGFLVGKNV